MSVRNAKFSRLKSFIQLQLPSGFPIRISIPLFHMINAQITFKNVNEPAPRERKIDDVEIDDLGLPVFRLNSSLFDIPKEFTIHRSSVSLLLGNIGHAEIDINDSSNLHNNSNCKLIIFAFFILFFKIALLIRMMITFIYWKGL